MHRKSVTITGQSGAGTNFQVKVKVGESAGAAGANFHLEGNSTHFPSAKDDGGDLRFTDNDGTTPLGFWVESVSGSAPNRTATVWVKVADDLGTNATIYCYYDKAGAANTSSGSATFLLFDDFDGSSLDTAKWTQRGSNSSISLSSSQLTFTNSTDAGYAWITSNATYAYPVWTESKVDSFNTNAATYRMGATTGVTPRVDNGNLYNEYSADALTGLYRIVSDTSSVGTTVTSASAGSDTSGIWSFAWASTGTQKFLVNYVSKLTGTDSSISIANHYMYLGNAKSLAGSTVVDWARVRKYASTEPAFSAAGTEENADVTPPQVSTLSPADDAINVLPTQDLVITFDEAVRTGTGFLTLKKSSDQSVIESIAASGALVSGNGTTSLTVNPVAALAEQTEFYVVWDAFAFKDPSGNHAAARTSVGSWSFTTGDVTSPTVSTFTPADNATDVLPTADLVISFDEAVRAGTGVLVIKKTADDSIVETIAMSGASVSGNGTASLTIDPSATLQESTEYYVVWDAHAFKDASYYANHAAAQTSATSWNFTTGDLTAPQVTGVSPAQDATNVALNANLTVTFNETARAGTGYLVLKKSSDQSTVETIALSGASLSGNGTSSLTLNPSEDLDDGTSYYVTWDAFAFKDASVFRNHASAQTSPDYWVFTTVDVSPPLFTSVTASANASGATITWNTNESGSSLVRYGTTSSLGSQTNEQDTGSGTTSHTVVLANLPACTTYFYRPVSTDRSDNAGTGSLASFTTSACTNSASVVSQTGGVVETTGGGLALLDAGKGLAVDVPTGAATNAFTLQVKKIVRSTVTSLTSTPSGTSAIDDHIYDIRAISGGTLVTTFGAPVSVTVSYADSQVSGYVESSLLLYRWDGSDWNALDNCALDTDANSITCETTHFSTFGLFGNAIPIAQQSDGVSTSANGGGGGTGGRRGSVDKMAKRIAMAQDAILAQYDARIASRVGTPEAPTTVGNAPRQRVAAAITGSTIMGERRGRLQATIDGSPVLYEDVMAHAWYTPYVAAIIEERVAVGYVDTEGKLTGEFGVANPVTRAEILKMALEASGTTIDAHRKPRNASARSTWASSYVAEAEELGLTVFSPDEDVHQYATRAEVMQTVLEVLKLPIAPQAPSFSDVPADHPYAHAIATADFYNLITGDTDRNGGQLRTFRPDDTMNRAEASKIIALLQKILK